MCDRIIYDDLFSLRYVPDQYKIPEMCDEAVDDYLAALKILPGWLVTSKNINTLQYADENKLSFNEDFINAVFNCNRMVILDIDLNKINRDDTNYDDQDPDSIILARLLALHIKFEKSKALTKMISQELMLIAWHSNR